jgi:hypothetical protein
MPATDLEDNLRDGGEVGCGPDAEPSVRVGAGASSAVHRLSLQGRPVKGRPLTVPPLRAVLAAIG